ncbi:hypothetical protein [Streptomyces sp. NPDC059788]|uniref:hypothetical protein n=1 Tax=Streptomyces sp. NPDC059788 TaxID=3346948 RepID=UPI003654B446
MKWVSYAARTPDGGMSVKRCDSGGRFRHRDSSRKAPALRSPVRRALLRSVAAGMTRAFAMALESTLTAVILFLLHSL